MKKNTANYDKSLIFFLGILTITVLILLSLSNLSLYLSKSNHFVQKSKIKVLGKKDFSLEEKNYWEKFLKSHPDYFPGWYELIKIEIKLGEKDNIQKAFSKAFKINPNSQELLNLKEEQIKNIKK